eukprot:scaffold67230_cov61-Phaeocystis_antarctica.AAC.3
MLGAWSSRSACSARNAWAAKSSGARASSEISMLRQHVEFAALPVVGWRARAPGRGTRAAASYAEQQVAPS